MVLLLRRPRVFQEKQMIFLQLFAQGYGLAGRDSLVNIVQQLDLVAQRRSEMLKQLGNGAQVGAGFPDELGIGWPNYFLLGGLAAGTSTIGRQARNRHLDPDMAVALCHCLTDVFLDLLEGAPLNMSIESGGKAAFPTQQLVDGHIGPLALNVP